MIVDNGVPLSVTRTKFKHYLVVIMSRDNQVPACMKRKDRVMDDYNYIV